MSAPNDEEIAGIRLIGWIVTLAFIATFMNCESCAPARHSARELFRPYEASADD